MATTHPMYPQVPSPAAVRAFEEAREADWEGGVSLHELLGRVNRAAPGFLPEEGGHGGQGGRDGKAGRVRREFTERSFRHYQTLRCIEPPQKRGRNAAYGFRHLVQALLVRALLWRGLPAGQIAEIIPHAGTGELERMLMGGVEMVARGEVAGGGEGGRTGAGTGEGEAETWRRVRVVPGVELHLRGGLPRPTPEELRGWLDLLEKALRRNL
jgi:DNA-binding transcriptional MerR regulator